VVGVEKCLLVKTCYGIYGSVITVYLVSVEDLGSFSTADIDESSEHQGAVCSRTVDGCFCRDLLGAAGVDELLEPFCWYSVGLELRSCSRISYN